MYTGAVSPGRPAQRDRPGARGGVSVGETFARLVTDGPLLVAAGRRGAGRADQLRLALRAAARARLPRLRLRPGRHRRPADRRPRRAAGGTATAVRTDGLPAGPHGARRAAVRARLHRRLRRLRGGVRRPGPAAARARRRAQPGVRRHHDPGRAGLPRLAAAAAAHHSGSSARPAAGLAGAPLLGIVFGLGWTPCLGPTLSAVYSLAFTEATATRGALLGVAYCLGLGIPFVLVALGRALGAWARRRSCAGTPAR